MPYAGVGKALRQTEMFSLCKAAFDAAETFLDGKCALCHKSMEQKAQS